MIAVVRQKFYQTPCERKVSYATESRARQAKAQAHKERGDWLRVYRCPECRAFHLTSKTKA